MPTGRSSTEAGAGPAARAGRAVRDDLADLRHLLAFRAGTVRRPRAAATGLLVALGVTLATALVPAYVDGAGVGAHARTALDWLPAAYVAFLALTVATAVASGGGRELLHRDQAAIHPVSPVTDHLGALVLAPLNTAWLLQTWSLLGVTAFAVGPVGPAGLLPAQVVALGWVLAATAVGQAVGWTVEVVRRRRNGVAAVRIGVALSAVVAGVLQLTGQAGGVLAGGSAWAEAVVGGVTAARDGAWGGWLLVAVGLLLVGLAAVVAGAWPAVAAARRPPRDELRLESGTRPSRPTTRTELGALMRVDRASAWRTVPMRRGLVVLALGPGLVALVGAMPWSAVPVLPGLVVSGAALLFGVNAWCLDVRGALWRESLPVAPQLVFAARTLVTAEWLATASAVTLGLASLRAGTPTAGELSAVLCTWLVVTVQVTAVSMSWSGRRPYAADLRSARATPAPPLVMVGYSARLALSTTLTAMLFSGLGVLPAWVPPVVAVPFLGWSAVRLRRARRRWLDPQARAGVVVSVAA